MVYERNVFEKICLYENKFLIKPNITVFLGNGSALDIASCDGPVRFHRILNPILMETDDESTTNEDTGI